MNEPMNGLLTQMRVKLTAEGEEAFGPDSEAPGSAGEPGESGAVNDTSAEALDAFNLYFEDILQDLLDEYAVSEEEAEDFMFSVLHDMVEAGEIPDMPEDEEDEAALSVWLGAAKSAGFEAKVLATADEESKG